MPRLDADMSKAAAERLGMASDLDGNYLGYVAQVLVQDLLHHLVFLGFPRHMVYLRSGATGLEGLPMKMHFERARLRV